MSDSVRLVLIATDSWDQINGITTLYRAVIRSIDDRFRGQWRLLIVHPADRAGDRSIGCGHRVIAMAPRWRFHLPQYPELITGYVSHKDFASLERRHGTVDVVHIATQGFLGLSATRYAAACRKPCVGFYHTNWPAYINEYLPALIPSRLKVGLARRWDRIVYGRCTFVIAHTTRTAPCVGSASRPEFRYTSSFVDVRRFAGGDRLPGSDHDAEPVVFGFVGRIAREKHLSEILNRADTIARLGCRLLIVGDGPERAGFERMNAEFVGYKHGDDLVAMYRAMHFLLLPARSDTLGLVLLEAAASGTPAVALRGTAAADLISRYESGVVVDRFDDGLFQWLLETARSDRLRHMRARARAMAADHDVLDGTATLVDTWRDAIRSDRSSRRTCRADS